MLIIIIILIVISILVLGFDATIGILVAIFSLAIIYVVYCFAETPQETGGNKSMSNNLYEKTIYNSYLSKTKTITARTEWELDEKVYEQEQRWTEMEKRQRERDKINALKNNTQAASNQASQNLLLYEHLLSNIIKTKYELNFDKYIREDVFAPFCFNKSEPELSSYFVKYDVPDESFFEKIFKSLKEKRIRLTENATRAFKSDLAEYENDKQTALNNYHLRKEKFDVEKENYNLSIKQWKSDYFDGKPHAIEKYIDEIFSKFVKYPIEIDYILKDYEVEFDPQSNTIIISMHLPLPEDMPHISGYKWVATTKSSKEIPLKKKEFDELYEKTICQITLSVIYILFSTDKTKLIQSAVFNGITEFIDKSTGNDGSACIISVQCDKNEFNNLNLNRVDAKECLNKLRAIKAGTLSSLTPVKPIMQLNRVDKRFIISKEILDELDDNYNLSEMPWEDFEHLVRELFSKIFSQDGAEVKVTKASKDGGVDAVAFDPDPIRGGKFVIQAKRYTKVVPVSAARDLYGTMINEGAVKGILVTTSHYGHDTYSFVKDKPITLIDGANLVYMLHQYGYKVTVNK